MNTLDFLAHSPNVFIHKQESNKTNFGGILFLIFIIVMIFIFLIYTIKYIKNDKYDIQYTPVYYDKDNLDQYAKSDIYNPYMELTVKLSGVMEELSERYLIHDIYKNEFISGNYSDGEITYKVNRNINYFNFDIVFKCQDDSCSDEIPLDYTGYKYSLIGQKFEIHNQDTIPIQIKNEERVLEYATTYDGAFTYSYEWNPIIYRESFGGFSNLFNSNAKDVYYNGECEYYQRNEIWNEIYTIGENNIVKILIGIDNAATGNILEFKKTKRDFMDVIANICSLFITLHSLFSVLLVYYTKRYNNYQILQRIVNLKNINKENPVLINSTSQKELTSDFNNIEMPLVDKISDKKDSEQNIKMIDNDKEENADSLEENINLPKFNFFDFYLNNFYFRLCKKSKKQEIINIANEITFKYLSIDYIVTYLMRLENLLKDYRWNNPSLNNIENNDLIVKLKTIL